MSRAVLAEAARIEDAASALAATLPLDGPLAAEWRGLVADIRTRSIRIQSLAERDAPHTQGARPPADGG